jgi:hypothetical protein
MVAGTRSPVRRLDGDPEQLTPEGGVQDVDEAGATIGHRSQVEHVVG